MDRHYASKLSFACIWGLILCGCGGGSGSSTKSLTSPVTNPSSTTPGTSAHFQVNVNTGKVTVTNGQGANNNSRTIFSGTTIGFNSSTLFNSANSSDNGTRLMNVSLTNNSGITLGSTNGINVEFSNFQNIGSFPDVRSLTNVSTLASGFNQPYGVAAAGSGTFYVADTFNNQIKLVSGGNVTLFAGNGAKGEVDGPASTAEFNLPVGLALYNGNLIVADYGGNKIRQISPSGQVTTLVSASTFNGPWGVTTDGSSNIYICEKGSNDVKTLSNGSVTTLAGGTAGNQDGVGSSARFYNPQGITYSSGYLYIADTGNNSVRQINASTGSVITIAGTGGVGRADGTGNVASFCQPRGVAVVNGSVIVDDFGTNPLDEIRQITPIQGTTGSNSSSWQTSTIAGNGFSGDTDGSGTTAAFNNPQLLAADPSGNIYVADTNNNSVREITPDNGIFPIGVPNGGTPSTELVQLSNPSGHMDSATSGQSFPYVNYPGTLGNGQVTASQLWSFNIPAGVTSFEFDVTVASATSAPIAIGGQTGAGDPSEIVSTYAGNPANSGFLNGPTNQARFGGPFIAPVWTPLGIFVTDFNNYCVDIITPSGEVSTIAGSPGRVPQDGLGIQAGFGGPNQIAADARGNLYVADSTAIRLMTYNGGEISSPSSWTVSTIAGSLSKTGSTDGSGTASLFSGPNGIAVDAADNVFVADFLNCNIRLMIPNGGPLTSASTWTVSTFAGPSGASAGTSGYTNSTGGAARFAGLQFLAIDPNGNLYVSDYSNDVIRKITRDGSVSTAAGQGPMSTGYLDGPASISLLHGPIGMACDSAGYVYFSDGTGAILRKLSPGGVVSTVAGSSSSAMAVDGPGNTARFDFLFAITLSPTGDIYVGDSSSIRLIQKQFTVGANSKAKETLASHNGL